MLALLVFFGFWVFLFVVVVIFLFAFIFYFYIFLFFGILFVCLRQVLSLDGLRLLLFSCICLCRVGISDVSQCNQMAYVPVFSSGYF